MAEIDYDSPALNVGPIAMDKATGDTIDAMANDRRPGPAYELARRYLIQQRMTGTNPPEDHIFEAHLGPIDPAAKPPSPQPQSSPSITGNESLDALIDKAKATLWARPRAS